jgi:ADP-heptose:LPS heptosyltransferase
VAASTKTHNLLLNLQLIDQDISPGKDLDKLFGQMELKKPVDLDFRQLKEKSYFFIQLSSGNMKTPYKNWPAAYWKKFLGSLQSQWPEITLVFIGDKNEIEYSKEIVNSLSDPVINLVGKTSLNEAAYLLQESQAYIGLDSGWMHLAAAMNLPTFTIFGASSNFFVGYEQFDPLRHRVLYSALDCWPCHAMIGNNISRVKRPMDCPDLKCLYDLKPEKVFGEFEKFYSF